MEFFEYGLKEGAPLVFLLGTPHTGDSVAELSGLAEEVGVRLICPTRSWYIDTSVEPSFAACTEHVMRYLKDNGIRHGSAMGGSGGGPFALHLASNHPETFAACYMLASMGDPHVFQRTVASVHTQALLKLFFENDYDQAIEQLGQWGLRPGLAHGIWADFRVLLGSWASIDLASPVPVYLHHGVPDDNAPLESVEALAAQLTNGTLRMSSNASHTALAGDPSFAEFRSIFTEVKKWHELLNFPS